MTAIEKTIAETVEAVATGGAAVSTIFQNTITQSLLDDKFITNMDNPEVSKAFCKLGVLYDAAKEIARMDEPIAHVLVRLYKSSGKYYTEEQWRIPEGAIGPYDMVKSPDYRLIGDGYAVVESQEPWGYPCLLKKD